MKKLLTLIFCLTGIYCISQTKEYNASSIYELLSNRIQRIENTLYDAALSGKIKAFPSDSLKGYYSPEYLKSLGSVTRSVQNSWSASGEADSVYITYFDPLKDGKGLCAFYRNLNADLKSQQQIFSINCLAIMYEPHAGNLETVLPVQPMFYLKFEEVERILTPSDFQLLVQLSNILLSDKRWGNYYNAVTGRIKIPFEEIFANGIINNFVKFSFIKNDAVQELAKNVYSCVVQSLLNDIKSSEGKYYGDLSLTQELSGDSLEKFKWWTIISANEDTTHSGRIEVESVGSIIWNGTAVGISLMNPEKSTCFIRKEDFNKFTPKWLSPFIFENLN